MEINLKNEIWNLTFEAGKSIRYHSYRRAWWLAWDHWTKVFSIVTGTGVVISSFAAESFWIRLFAIVTAGASAGDVVFGFSSRAAVHERLYQDWSQFQQTLILCLEPEMTIAAISKFKARRLEIEQHEPDHIDLLERRCAAEEATARGCPLRDAWKLTSCQNLFAQWSFFPSSFRSYQ